MIFDLSIALDLNNRHKISDFFVSRDVFMKVLNTPTRNGENNFIYLNQPYSSPMYRFINKSIRNGVEFVYLSNYTLTI